MYLFVSVILDNALTHRAYDIYPQHNNNDQQQYLIITVVLIMSINNTLAGSEFSSPLADRTI